MSWTSETMNRTGRLVVGVVGLLAVVMTPGRVHAQYNGAARTSWGPPGAHGPAAPSSMAPYWMPAGSHSLYGQGQPGYPGGHPAPYPDTGPGCESGGPVVNRIYDHDDLSEPSPLESFISTAMKNSRFRLEYLLWEIDEPSNVFLGAPIQGVANPREPFPVFDFQEPPNQIGTAQVADLSRIGLEDNNGISGTLSVPLTNGWFELNAFLLEQASDNVVAPLPQQDFFFATSTRLNGQPSNNVFLYDQSFKATYTSDIWGTEILWVHDDEPLNGGLKMLPVWGLRYLSIQEQLRQVGVASDIQNGPLTSVIDSDTTNNIYASSGGMRFELVTEEVTLGVEPKVGIGGNSLRARVTTENLRSFDDPQVETTKRHTIFSPVAELGAYVRWRVREHFSLHVGYRALWAFRITRPERNIFYNDNGIENPPAITVDPEIDDLKIHGLTLGGEVILP